jgi:hypothetical protein
MYRQVFTPMLKESVMNFPPGLYGKNVEVIIVPLSDTTDKPAEELQAERRRTREENNRKYSFSTKNFKFNRDEANDYE